tara:strand:- start:531 stop:959 length:429 start_codon:yes stop_codon:yes gene_type:complete
MNDILITIVIAALSLFVGFVGGIYLPQKFRRDDKRPIVSIGPFQERFNLFEVTNHGGDLLNFSVAIEWLQDGKKEKRVLTRFLNANDNPLKDRAHTPGSLKKSETKKATECPTYSDNSNVKVSISGKSIDGVTYSEKMERVY